MTSLRQRLTQDLQLRGYSDRTVEAYVRAVAQLAKFYHASPDRLCEEQPATGPATGPASHHARNPAANRKPGGQGGWGMDS